MDLEAMQRSGYIGPAPVTLAEFIDRVNMQKAHQRARYVEKGHEAIKELTIDETIVEQAGPALNSGRAILHVRTAGKWQDFGRIVFRKRFSRFDPCALRDHH